MTLLGDLVDCYAATTSTDPSGEPPVRYTTVADRTAAVGGSLFAPSGRHQQLRLTTGESTLFSVLQLIASKTAQVKWYGERPVRNQAADQEPPRVDETQSLAVKLWQRPNKFMSGKFVRTMMTWHYRAVGEAWAVMDFLGKPGSGTPRSWWPVRPDRMWPVPDPDDYLVGYIYVGPDGTRVPLELGEVMRMTFPDPFDPHRGLGVVQTLGTTLGVSLTSEQWIARFFDNDASPGGIIELNSEPGNGLSDSEWNKLRQRWNEQHRGVNKAHRIAIMEYGSFKPRQFNMKDMQFAEIRQLTRDQVLEAFRIHKHKMGISDDVNLANAYAADATFAKDETVPNLEEWEELANGSFRDMFGSPGKSVRLCYENPVPSDKADDRAERKAKIEDAVLLAEAGVDWDEACEFVGLPKMSRIVVESEPEAASDDVEKPEPEAPEADKAAGELDETAKGDPLALATISSKLYLATEGNSFLKPAESRQFMVDAGADIDPEAWEDDAPAPVLVPNPEQVPAEDDGSEAGSDPAVVVPAPAGDGDVPEAVASQVGPQAVTVDLKAGPRAASGDVDLSRMAEDWQDALDALLAKWPNILDQQYSALANQVRDMIDAGDLDALLELITPDAGAATVLTLALVAIAVTGAAAVEREAKAQGVSVDKAVPEKTVLETQAKVTTGLMRQALSVSAGREALRLAGSGVDANAVADGVREHLDALTDAQPRQAFAGVLTAAQNAGRMATLAAAPVATYFASEVLDNNTCSQCRKVEGKKYSTLAASQEDYPRGGYRDCLGMERCRGTVVAVWSTEDGDDE